MKVEPGQLWTWFASTITSGEPAPRGLRDMLLVLDVVGDSVLLYDVIDTSWTTMRLRTLKVFWNPIE